MLDDSKKGDVEITPYEKVKTVLDKRINQALDQGRNWRFMTLLCLSLLGLSIMGNIYLGQKSKHIPYVVAVQASGEATTLNSAQGLPGPTLSRAISFFLSRFVMLARDIPADPVLLRDNMGKLFQLVSAQGKTLLADKFRDNSPSEEFIKKHRALKIASVLEVSKGVYHLDWYEAEYDKQGQKIAEYPMRGTFKIAMLEPKSDAQIKENPLGIFIDYFSWTRLGG
jgi:type IV secretory pathway TrbF-like protein